MTTSSPGDDPLSGRSPPGPAPRGADDPGELPDDLEAFLVRLGKAVQRHGLYPAGHPALEPIVDDVLDVLGRAFGSRDRVSLGVAPDRLLHEEGESDPSHPLLSSLAGRLHAHHVSRLTFRPGVEADELSAFLGEAARSPETSEEALGRRRELTDGWPHVLVEPVRYDALSMVEETADEETAGDVEGDAGDLWLGLARSVLAEEALDDLDEDEAPSLETMISALSEVTADRARARTVAARMVALAQMLARADEEDDEGAGRVEERFLRLIDRLGPRNLGKLLSAAPQQQRQAFLQATMDWLPSGTVVELLDELADSRDLDVSYQMLRLLSKLASYADLDADALDPEAGVAFREQVRRLVGGWRENLHTGRDESIETEEGEGDEGPEAGAERDRGADGIPAGALSGADAPVLPDDRTFVDPARLVRTALEVGTLGPLGREAIAAMTRESRTDDLLDILHDAPDRDAAEAAWEQVDLADALRTLLGRSPPDFEAVDALMERRAASVAGPLLDLLSESDSRSVRRQLFSRLAAMEGKDVNRAILERLDDDRWFVQRNMLALLVERTASPEGFTPLPYTRHSRAEVRKEAYKLAFRLPSERAEAVRRALDDADRKALSLGLGALQTLPSEVVDDVVPRLRERLEGGDLPAELERQAVRALGRSDEEEAFEALMGICRTRKMWRFWTVDLAEKSPAVLAAIEALARRWSDRPEAREVLARAREADDPELRDAVRVGSEAA